MTFCWRMTAAARSCPSATRGHQHGERHLLLQMASRCSFACCLRPILGHLCLPVSALRAWQPACVCRRQWLDAEHGTQAAAAMLAEAAAEEAAAAAALGVRRVGTMEDLTCIDEDLGDGCAHLTV